MAPQKSMAQRTRMITINRVTDLVARLETKATEIHAVLNNSKKLKLESSETTVNFDKMYEEIYQYVLIEKIDSGDFSYEAYYDENTKTHMIKLVNFMVETIKLCVFATPNLMIPVRIPMLIENIKKLRLPKYMIYTILILGTQLLPESRVTRFLSAKKVGKLIKYVRKVLDDKQNKFRINHLWCLQALLEQKTSNKFNHAARVDQMKTYSTCIMLGLHKVDSSAYLGLSNPKQEQNQMEFRRRMFWMVYLNHSIQAGFANYTIYGAFFKNANKLPKNDYEWRNGVEYKTSTLILVENRQLIRSSESRRVNPDITKLKCIVLGMHNKICAFRNRRSFMIKRDYQRDFERYTDLSKQLNGISKMLRRYTFDTLQKLQLFENANFLIIDQVFVKNLLFQLCCLRLSLINAAVHLCMTEILYLEYFNNDFWRVQVAKMLCIDYSIEGIKILKWGYANIPVQCMDLNLHFLICWICLTLINAAYITDHPKYTEIVEGRDFVYCLLEKLEPEFQRGGEFDKVFVEINNTMRYFHKINRMVNPVPSIIVNSAITEEDMNPWFIIGPPPCAGSWCCLLATSNINLRVLSLKYYINYPNTPCEFDDLENLTDLLNSFSISLDFPLKKNVNYVRNNSQPIRNSSKTVNMLIDRFNNIGTNRIYTLNIRKPPEYYSWSKRRVRTSTKSLFRLFFPEYGVAGCDIGYSLN